MHCVESLWHLSKIDFGPFLWPKNIRSIRLLNISTYCDPPEVKPCKRAQTCPRTPARRARSTDGLQKGLPAHFSVAQIARLGFLCPFRTPATVSSAEFAKSAPTVERPPPILKTCASSVHGPRETVSGPSTCRKTVGFYILNLFTYTATFAAVSSASSQNLRPLSNDRSQTRNCGTRNLRKFNFSLRK